jgi:hypothetical protein
VANDSAFGGSGGELTPLKETRVQMAWEEITLEKRSDPEVTDLAWYVSARYEFHNPTKEVVKLQIGYPETHCNPDADCIGQGGRFRRLKTQVRGQAVKPRVGEVDPKLKWAPPMGQVYLFDVTFQPGERVLIEHQYTYDPSYSVDGEWVDYLTRTGAFWAGPIGRARFTVRMPERPLGVVAPPQYKLQSYKEAVVNGAPQTELVFENRDWTPTRDFELYFPNVINLGQDGCPSFDHVHNTWTEAGKKDQVAIEQHFQALDREALRTCRNWPYARHGYSFKSRALHEHFYEDAYVFNGVPWYPSRSQAGKKGKPEDQWRFLPMRPNPDFSPKLLTPQEQLYVRLIKAAEAARASKK